VPFLAHGTLPPPTAQFHQARKLPLALLNPRKVGKGDMDLGHRALDEFIKRFRAETIKTLQKLPPPKKD
jgi:hypothetical protein